MKIVELFQKLANKQSLPPVVLGLGDDAYLEGEIKRLVKKSGWQLETVDFPKDGPKGSHEQLTQGGSLFFTKTFLWIKVPASLTNWSKKGQEVWARMSARASSDELILFVQGPADKRLKWTALGKNELISLEVSPSERMSWVKRMADIRSFKLLPEQLTFLSTLDADLMSLDNMVDLWSLGGDLWAERSLGWKQGASQSANAPVVGNSFDWVDAVLRRDRVRALKLQKQLFEEGQDAIPLIALLGKSAMILALIEKRLPLTNFHDFLVQKVRAATQVRGYRVGWGAELLGECARIDLQLKSTRAKPEALFVRLVS